MPIGGPLANENNRPMGAEFQPTDGEYDPTNGKQSPKMEITNENRGVTLCIFTVIFLPTMNKMQDKFVFLSHLRFLVHKQ